MRNLLKARARRNTSRFLAVPCDVLNSERYRGLSFKARALLFDLGAQFNGYNNGDLCAAWSLMRKRGWVSKQTLQNARDELLNAELIELTRQGSLHCASLYALTWLPIDECGGKLDVRATSVASGAWKLPAKKNPTLTPKIGATNPDQRGTDPDTRTDTRGKLP